MSQSVRKVIPNMVCQARSTLIVISLECCSYISVLLTDPEAPEEACPQHVFHMLEIEQEGQLQELDTSVIPTSLVIFFAVSVTKVKCILRSKVLLQHQVKIYYWE